MDCSRKMAGAQSAFQTRHAPRLCSGERTRLRVLLLAPRQKLFRKVRDREGAIASTRGACAPRSKNPSFLVEGKVQLDPGFVCLVDPGRLCHQAFAFRALG